MHTDQMSNRAYINQVESYIMYLYYQGLNVPEIGFIVGMDKDLVSTIIILEISHQDQPVIGT